MPPGPAPRRGSGLGSHGGEQAALLELAQGWLASPGSAGTAGPFISRGDGGLGEVGSAGGSLLQGGWSVFKLLLIALLERMWEAVAVP